MQQQITATIIKHNDIIKIMIPLTYKLKNPSNIRLQYCSLYDRIELTIKDNNKTIAEILKPYLYIK